MNMINNILVVDDNKYILDSLSINFCVYLKDCNVLTAGNGLKAVEIVNTVPIDFILTDLQMPVMDGFEFIEYTKKNHPHIPVMAMTGNYTPEVTIRLHSLGVYQYVEKPFDFEGLLEVISRQLKERALVVETTVSAAI